MDKEERYMKQITTSFFRHYKPKSLSDNIAYRLVKFLRFFADKFFAKRYGHRAVVLETIAAVPGMVGGAFLHLKSLRKLKDDDGWIQTLLDEAENERMHLMSFVEIAQPTRLERFFILLAQVGFCVFYSLLYLISSRIAHRLVGYLEEEAIISYTQYLDCIRNGEIENIPAPDIAIKHWKLPEDTKLDGLICIIRKDELHHREVNHCMSDKLNGKSCSIQYPEDMPEGDKQALNEYSSRSSP